MCKRNICLMGAAPDPGIGSRIGTLRMVRGGVEAWCEPGKPAYFDRNDFTARIGTQHAWVIAWRGRSVPRHVSYLFAVSFDKAQRSRSLVRL
jgi:hypothetical protein